MSLKFIDYPTEISVPEYEKLKSKLTSQLTENDSVLSVYQMGSVRHPGISDLDIICVFKNGSKCIKNNRLDLNTDEKNILTHGIFGIEEKDLIKSMSYNLISNLQYLGGKELNLNNKEINTSSDIKKQIALEYLVKMLITIDAQVTLRIIKLRAFLLLAKAIEFDLELLDIRSGKLYDLVKKVIQYRSRWYTQKPSNREITTLVFNFNKELRSFLEKELLTTTLYLPNEILELPGNFIIKQSEMFSIEHKGIVLPNQLSFLGKKYINLQYRINTFIYKLKFNIPNINSPHQKRFEFSKKMVQKNKKSYPNFIPLTTSLSIY